MKSLFSLFIVLAIFNSNSVWALTAKEIEIRTWSYTELTPLWVIGNFEEKFCRKNPDYFRGCFAGLDMLAQQVNPLYRLVLEAEVKDQPVILATKTLRVVQTAAPVNRTFPEEQREFWKAERIRYQPVSRLIPVDIAPEIQDLSQQLMAKREPLQPYEIGRILNATNSYIYDPQSRFFPTFRYNATPVAPPRPGPGIVIELSPKGWLVQRVLRPSSAYEKGVKRGDLIESIDNTLVAGLERDAVEDLMAKKEKQAVKISVSREGTALSFNLTAKLYTQDEFIRRTLELNGQKFGYLGIETTHNTAVEVYCSNIAKELIRFEKEVRGLILDLRGKAITDTSDMAACIGGFFVGSKQHIFSTKSLYNQTLLLKALPSTKKVFWKPLVILQDEETEGAMELISGSLQQLGRAFVIGETSKGNGTEPTVSINHRVDRIETGFVQYLPSGESHHNVGVAPDLKVWRSETPNYFESTALRYSEIGVPQVIPGKVAPLINQRPPFPISIDCLKQQNIKSQYSALPTFSQDKDLQFLTGLNALYCSQN